MIDEKIKRPLSNMEIFRISMDIYKKNIKYIICMGVFVYLPMYIIISFVPEQMIPNMNEIISGVSPVKLMYYFIMMVVLYVVFTPLAMAAVTYISKQYIEGKSCSFGGMLDVSLLKWGRHMLTALLYIAVIILCSPIIVPSLYFGIAFNYCTCAVVITEKWGMRAMIESRECVRGKWFGTFAFLVLTALLTTTVSNSAFNIMMSIGLMNNSVLSAVSSVIINILCVFFNVAIAVKYLNEYCMRNAAKRNNEEQHI